MLLPELAVDIGLVDAVSEGLADTYGTNWVHAPGRVFADLIVELADGTDCVSGIAVLADRGRLFGPVAPRLRRRGVLERTDAAHLPSIAAARRQRRGAHGRAAHPRTQTAS